MSRDGFVTDDVSRVGICTTAPVICGGLCTIVLFSGVGFRLIVPFNGVGFCTAVPVSSAGFCTTVGIGRVGLRTTKSSLSTLRFVGVFSPGFCLGEAGFVVCCTFRVCSDMFCVA